MDLPLNLIKFPITDMGTFKNLQYMRHDILAAIYQLSEKVEILTTICVVCLVLVVIMFVWTCKERKLHKNNVDKDKDC